MAESVIIKKYKFQSEIICEALQFFKELQNMNTQRHVAIYRMKPLILFMLTPGHQKRCFVFATTCPFYANVIYSLQGVYDINISELKHQKAANFPLLYT